MLLPQGIGWQQDIFGDGDALDQVELLKDESEGPAPYLRQEPFGQACYLYFGRIAVLEEPIVSEQLSPKGDTARRRPRHAADEAEERRLSRSAGTFQDRDPVFFQGEFHTAHGNKFVRTSDIKSLSHIQ